MDFIDSKQKSSPQSWDDNDDKLLIQLKEIEHLGWKQISKYFNNRTSNACQFRWRRLKSGQLKKLSKSKKFLTQNYILNENEQMVANGIAGAVPYPYTNGTNPKSVLYNSTSFNQYNQYPHYVQQAQWTIEEDNLIRSRIMKKLSIVELSILLPNKSTIEIESRINFLERKKLTISALLTDASDSDVDAHSNISTPTRRSSFSSNNSTMYTTNAIAKQQQQPMYAPNHIPMYHHHHQHPVQQVVQMQQIPPPQPQSQQIVQPSAMVVLPSIQQNNPLVNSNNYTQNVYPVIYSTKKYPSSQEKLPSLSKIYNLLN